MAKKKVDSPQEDQEEPVKGKKRDRAKGEKKRLDISARAFADNIVFSKTNRWAYYRVANNAYDFLDDATKVRYAHDLSNALTAVFTDSQDPMDFHMISTSTPIDIDLWEDQVKEVSDTWKRTPGFGDYVAEQSMFLRQKEYMRKITYLGVDLGKRGAMDISAMNALEIGFGAAFDNLKKFSTSAFRVPGSDVSEKEELTARNREKEVYTILASGSLRAQRVSTEELLLLIKRQLWPAMPSPYLDVDHESRAGAFDLALESVSAIRKRYRWLEITQQFGEHKLTGYRACLSVAKLPKVVNFPKLSPFLYVPAQIGLPFTVYSRFCLLPNQKMQRTLYKKDLEQRDQLSNMAAGGHDFDASVMEQMSDMSALKYQLGNDNSPWVQGSYRIVVETPSEDSLKSFCAELRQTYAGRDIALNWTSGDQVDLFLEQMPGDRLRVGAFNMLTNMSMMGISGLNISSDIGDPLYSDVDI